MKLVIVSGRSGSGKSTALNVLEDLGYYCIDNLPVGLLLELVSQSSLSEDQRLGLIAVSIDARNLSSGIEKFPDFHRQCVAQNIDVDVLFLDAHNDTLLKRFHSTRRKHPLSNTTRSLKEAIAHERELLDPIAANADLTINTSDLTLYELRDLVKLRVAGRKTQEIALLFQSFGFKHGVPSDADFVFDVRCLPNPYWDPTLRGYTGLEDPVIQFLSEQPESEEMAQDIISFLNKWIPRFQNSNRSYMTIAIGCTGGQHRSVYLCEKIGRYFSTSNDNVQIRHKELPSTTE
jgi:RNase adapter protein RapZ